MAVVLSAIRVVERITGQSWDAMRTGPGAAEVKAIPSLAQS
jgi:hypothetical protein